MKQRIVFFSVIILLFFIAWFWANLSYEKIMDNKGIATGIILGYSNGKSSGFDYEFFVKGIKHKGYGGHMTGGTKYLINKEFPVVYDTTNPSNHALLMFPEDFEKFHETFPDSLHWILKYSHF